MLFHLLVARSYSFRIETKRTTDLPSGTVYRMDIAVSALTFSQIKQREARSRKAVLRAARRSPRKAAELQRRASLVGRAAGWRITNFKQVARAMAKWA